MPLINTHVRTVVLLAIKKKARLLQTLKNACIFHVLNMFNFTEWGFKY